MIPEEYASSSKYIASGLLVLRTSIFGLPNLIDGVSQREGVKLNPEQHRKSFKESLRKNIFPYYIPPAPLIIEINEQLVDPETRELNSEGWVSNGDPDNYLVFPRPEIVQQVNEAAAKKDLPVQTSCPSYHSKVTTFDKPDTTTSLPYSLADMALQQLKTWYYPQREKEWLTEPTVPTDVFVA
jgi:hypothetical protein